MRAAHFIGEQFSSISPYPVVLHEHVTSRKWDEAVRLCRFVKDKALWSSLAVMAAEARHLNTAENAYAEIEEIDKVEYIKNIKDIPTVEGRNAALAVFCHQIDEGESLLLQAGLVYRAIELNLKLFRWERFDVYCLILCFESRRTSALDLAVKNKTHVDTVVGRRQLFLESLGRQEQSKKFLQLEGVEVNWETINSKIALELEDEKKRPSAKPL